MLRVHFPVDTASHIAMHAFSFVHAAPNKITDACTKHMHAQMKSEKHLAALPLLETISC